MAYVLRLSELCLQRAAQSLHDGAPVDPSAQTRMLVFGFGCPVCACACAWALLRTLSAECALADALVAAALLSLAVFLLVSAMKHIAFAFQFFRACDIENGALGLLTEFSLIVRYVTVAPVWLAFLAGRTLRDGLPQRLSGWCTAYALTKLAGFWMLCVDFSGACRSFFCALMRRAPPRAVCAKCGRSGARIETQCAHCFCRDCIERARKANGECPVCRRKIPRKWTMPYRFGALPVVEMFCIF